MGRRINIHFVDGDIKARAESARLALALGHHAEVYSALGELTRHPPKDGIVIARGDLLPGGPGEILAALFAAGIWLPLIIASEATGPCCIVEAIRAGALDFLALPLEEEQLAAMLQRVAGEAPARSATQRRMIEAREKVGALSEREREVLELLVEGGSNKLIARALEISPRTVEIHRARMMAKLGASHVAEVVQLWFEARLCENTCRPRGPDWTC